MTQHVCSQTIMKQTFAFVFLRHHSLLPSTCISFLSQSYYSDAVTRLRHSICHYSSVNVCQGRTAPPQLGLLSHLVIVLYQSFIVKSSGAAALYILVITATVPIAGITVLIFSKLYTSPNTLTRVFSRFSVEIMTKT